MKKSLLIISACLLFTGILIAQLPPSLGKLPKQGSKLGIGVKGGVNFANVRNAESFSTNNRTGFMIGGFLNPGGGSQIGGTSGFRTELIFSRQGYDYKANMKTGSVTLDYILLPQLYTINIGKVAQLQVGGQIAFLINAKADSSGTQSGTQYGSVADYYNRIDYGAAGGLEITPTKGFIVGGRYNISFAKTQKDPSDFPIGPLPGFIPPPGTDFKNNVVQVYVGYKF